MSRATVQDLVSRISLNVLDGDEQRRQAFYVVLDEIQAKLGDGPVDGLGSEDATAIFNKCHCELELVVESLYSGGESDYERVYEQLVKVSDMLPDENITFDSLRLDPQAELGFAVKNADGFLDLPKGGSLSLPMVDKSIHGAEQFQLTGVDDVQISFDDLIIKECIGKGTFGCVFEAMHGSTRVAVKVRTNQDCAFSSLLGFVSELEQWKKFDHPNIVNLLGFCFDTTAYKLGFVMDFCDSSLHEYIHVDKHPVSLDMILAVGSGVAMGLGYLHEKNIVHRDVKPKNILLSNGYQSVKLCDFGGIVDNGGSTIQLSSKTNMSTVIGNVMGTPAYMAPELCCMPIQVSSKCDIYAFGVVLWETVEGKIPFDSMSSASILRLVAGGGGLERGKAFEAYPKPLSDLVDMCCVGNRHQRPDTRQIYHILYNCQEDSSENPACILSSDGGLSDRGTKVNRVAVMPRLKKYKIPLLLLGCLTVVGVTVACLLLLLPPAKYSGPTCNFAPGFDGPCVFGETFEGNAAQYMTWECKDTDNTCDLLVQANYVRGPLNVNNITTFKPGINDPWITSRYKSLLVRLPNGKTYPRSGYIKSCLDLISAHQNWGDVSNYRHSPGGALEIDYSSKGNNVSAIFKYFSRTGDCPSPQGDIKLSWVSNQFETCSYRIMPSTKVVNLMDLVPSKPIQGADTFVAAINRISAVPEHGTVRLHFPYYPGLPKFGGDRQQILTFNGNYTSYAKMIGSFLDPRFGLNVSAYDMLDEFYLEGETNPDGISVNATLRLAGTRPDQPPLYLCPNIREGLTFDLTPINLVWGLWDTIPTDCVWSFNPIRSNDQVVFPLADYVNLL
eukprot:CAMPEP_0203763402 /NCGR_PEP_ID=MMETSP0098-20131031/16138_1 /ASSEMBLY_ACC=CAM_ASM_000208 /TAXON_ID=96639 /ORGANISM=" , Strain NY0313808BC1" /LENGTH=839 /DNA_ID=CAMNT_0050658191 /DNA_START=549 /DNA_END=3065 /DNA_ORIENTATION=-